MKDEYIENILGVKRSRDVTEDVTNAALHGKLTAQELGKLAKQIEIDKMETLAKDHLGFTDADVSHINHQAKNNPFRFNLATLDKWNTKNSGDRQVIY